MTLLAFQLALADLAASAGFCARAANDADAALAGYDLTPVERRRLASAAGQRGMRVNWALYRYNRITTLATVLPGTLHLLGDGARAVADAFWGEHGPDRNMRREAERFTAFVLRMLSDGRLVSPYLREVVEFELMRYQVAVAPPAQALARVAAAAERWPHGALAPHPLVRVAAFTHDPQVLLSHVGYKQPLPYHDATEGEFYLLLDCRAGRLEQRALSVAQGRLLRDAGLRRGAAASVEAEALAAEGILVRAGPAQAGEADVSSLLLTHAPEPQPA
jgi:hypothetical protein